MIKKCQSKHTKQNIFNTFRSQLCTPSRKCKFPIIKLISYKISDQTSCPTKVLIPFNQYNKKKMYFVVQPFSFTMMTLRTDQVQLPPVLIWQSNEQLCTRQQWVGATICEILHPLPSPALRPAGLVSAEGLTRWGEIINNRY